MQNNPNRILHQQTCCYTLYDENQTNALTMPTKGMKEEKKFLDWFSSYTCYRQSLMMLFYCRMRCDYR
jgi:hypothetical protein